MATSLARQLAALRTPATQAVNADMAFYSGPFLFVEADQSHCDLAMLKDKMKLSLDQLIDMDATFQRFLDFLVDERLDDRLESECVEELLFLLSSYLLMKPAQWVLQYMVIKHKVHYKYAELFFFCVLPYYEYDIYAKSLLAIDTIPGGSEYPNWFIKFKAQCAPTTKLALYRHTAADKGFLKLLTDTMIKLTRMTVNFPALRIQRQTSMFVMTVLGGMENKDKITEEQTLYILQVIFKAMKSSHPELIAMAQILVSYLLPKMAFKEKVVLKMLKSLKNCVKKAASMECLMVLIMIIRTQTSVQLEKAWPIMVSLEVVINQALNLLDDVETVHNLDDVLYTLASLIQPAIPENNSMFVTCPPAVNKMLGFASHIISSVPVSSDTAAFIGDVAYNLIRCIRDTPEDAVVDAESVRNVKDHAEHIMKQMNARYPDVYQQVVRDTDDVDVFFVGQGGLTKKPDEGLVAANKVILNNDLISVVKDRLISPKLKADARSQKAWRKNLKDVRALVSVDTEFLLNNLPGDNFQNVLLNILNFQQDAEVQDLVLGHLCHKEVWHLAMDAEVEGDTMQVDVETDAKKESVVNKRVVQYRLEMALLPFFCQENVSSRKVVTESYFGKKSELISCLSSISPEHPDKRGAVSDKLKMFVTTELANHVMQDSFVWENLDILALYLPAFKEKVVWNNIKIEKLDLIRFIGKLMVTNPEMEDKLTEGVILELLDGSNFTTTIEDGVVIMEHLPLMIEKGAKKFVSYIEQQIELKKKDEESALRFNLSCGVKTKCIKTKYLILSPILHLLQIKEFVETLLDPAANIFPMFLFLVLSEDQNVRKLGFTIIKKLKKPSVGKKYESIIQFLSTNRTELITDVSNLTGLLKKAELGQDGAQTLLQSTTKVDPVVFETLMPFFTNVKSTEAIKDVSEFGLNLIESGQNDDALACVIKKFYKRIIKDISEESCYKFFLACLTCGRIVTVAGIQLRVADVMLDRATSQKLWSGLSQDVLVKLLKDAVALSAESANVKLILMLCIIQIPVEMIINLFYSVWGEENLKSKSRGGRGNFTSQDAGLDQAQLKIWGATVFLLELLDCYLPASPVPSTDSSDMGWQTIIPIIFAVFRKLTNDDVMESSYKLNMILTVLLKLFSILPDSRIKELKQGDLEPELLTYCIRRSSNPESRQLALKVLARCSVTIPEYVLQNSMTIFTFMGTHLLKMDSKHSYQIACEAIDVIIPAMKSTSNSKQELQKISLEILNNFIHMEEDVPEHRYSEFVYRLIKALDAETYLWIAMLLCIKSTFKSKHRVKRTHLIHRRLTELIQRFTLQEALRGIIGIFVNLRSDAPQLRKIFGCSLDRREDKPDKADEWDVLRLGGLLLVSKLVSSQDLVARVGTQLLSQPAEVKDLLHLVLESSFLTLECFSSLPESTPEKLKTSILEQGESCLQLVLALLPYKLYITIVAELLASSNSTLRRRAMEVVSSKLDSVDPGTVDLSRDAAQLLPALLELAVKETTPENQQIAFLSLRQVSKQVTDYALLNTALATLNPKFLDTLSSPGVLGAAILTLTDILLTAGVQGVQHLDSVVKWLLASFKSINSRKLEEKYEKVVYTSLLLATQKIIEKFGGFLNPYLDGIVLVACRLYSHSVAASRARELWNSLAQHLSPHVLLPKAKNLLETVWKEPATVAKLSGLVGLNSKKLDRGQLNTMDRQLVGYFSKALTYRQEHPPSDQVNAAESEIIEAFLTVGLKMCLDDFKPVFNRLVEKLKGGAEDTSLITMFNFTERISNSLKNLFGFGVEFVLSESTRVLTNQSCSILCAQAVLRCLSCVFVYNKITELPKDVYENLVSAIIPIYQRDVSLHQNIQDALLVLADATVNDVYWKHLNFKVLMELRSDDSAVKIQILRLVSRFVTVKKDTYMVVLPDAVSFLTEALEDDDQEVEKECRDLIHHMETVFGQDIEDYFT